MNCGKTFLGSYVEHMDKVGWFDITYMAMDERPLLLKLKFALRFNGISKNSKRW